MVNSLKGIASEAVGSAIPNAWKIGNDLYRRTWVARVSDSLPLPDELERIRASTEQEIRGMIWNAHSGSYRDEQIMGAFPTVHLTQLDAFHLVIQVDYRRDSSEIGVANMYSIFVTLRRLHSALPFLELQGIPIEHWDIMTRK